MRIKNFIVILLLLFITVNAGMAQTPASDPVSFGDWTVLDNGSGWTIVGYSGGEKELVIPDSLEDKPVTRLNNSLFSNDSSLQSIFIPDSVTVIGASAFYGCTSLREVRLPKNLTRIEASTFRYCTGLEKIDLPFTVNFIGVSAFADCIKLKEILLLSVTSIGDSAFDNCSSLSSVMSSKKTTSVGSYAFRDTPWLAAQTDEYVFYGKNVLIKWNGTGSAVDVPYGTTIVTAVFEDNQTIESVSLPDTVTQLGTNTFKGAVNLKQVNIPYGMTAIGAGAFDGCFSLEEIELPETVKSIGASAFRSCNSLKEVVLPSQITTIQNSVFENCPSLTAVSIPAAVTKIDNNGFLNSPNIKLHTVYGSFAEQFAVEKEIPYLTVSELEGDFIFSRDADGITVLRYVGKLPDVEVPASIQKTAVTKIGTAAFQNNEAVQRVIIPVSVKTIEDWAFSYMPSLEYVQIPAGLKQIGSNVFTGSSGLKEIKLPRRLTSIGDSPFDMAAETLICAQDTSEAARVLREMGYEIRPNDACSENSLMTASWGELNDNADCSTCPTPDLTGMESEIDTETKTETDTETEKMPDIMPETEIENGTDNEPAAVIKPVVRTKEISEIGLVRIPDDVTDLTADLLKDYGSSLILVIPGTVATIDEQILEGRTLTIVSVPGSVAEAFAMEHDIQFLTNRVFTLGI